MSRVIRVLLTLAAVAVLAGMAYLVARAWPQLFPERVVLAPDPACDLRVGPCERALPGGGRLRFAVSPAGLPLMEPLALEVTLDQVAARGVQVDISGLNMDMGPNRTRLQPEGPGRWVGTTVLPACSSRVMEWDAAVWLELPTGVWAVPHRFATRGRP